MLNISSPSVEGAMASYTCPEGYTLQGHGIRLCVNGNWTGTEPNCTRKSNKYMYIGSCVAITYEPRLFTTCMYSNSL